MVEKTQLYKKPIRGLEKYKVSADGTVWSVSFRNTDAMLPIKPFLRSKGYLTVRLSAGDGTRCYRYIHRLVAEAFKPNPQNKPCVNHKDGNKLNNHMSNLEWVTYSENNKHLYRVLKKY